MLKTAEDRFWEKVAQSDDGCWQWTGAKNGHGQANFWDGHRYVHAYRFAYDLLVGEIPPGLNVCHRCDNPGCVRPSHLFLGTQLDNMRDMIQKGRRGYTGLPGEKNPKAKLTRVQVEQIRRDFSQGSTRAELAESYNMSWSTINRIVRGEYWKTEADHSATTLLLPEDY